MVKKKVKKTKKKKLARQIKIKPFKAQLVGEKVFSIEKEAKDLYEKNCFGELGQDKIHYSFVEALYLLDKKRIKMYFGKKLLNFDTFLQKACEIEPHIYTRFIVFKDMRDRGYIIKTALKFGADFRVYDKGVKPGQDHAKWILYPIYENSVLTWHEFAAKNRVAHSTRKRLLIAIVDDEADVTYYEIAWKKP